MHIPTRAVVAGAFILVMSGSVMSGSLGAQSATLPPPAVSSEEAAAMAQYWTLLAQGRFDESARTVATLISRYPRNTSALALLVEMSIAHGGPVKALDAYEVWLGGRTIEEPGVLRRIARAYLYESGRQTQDSAARTEALLALVRDGDVAAAAALGGDPTDGRGQSGPAGAAAVDRLGAQMKAASGMKLREIQRLADTGNPRAAAALVEVLRDEWPENRAAAATALGKLGRAEDIVVLRPLLQDPHGAVRVQAAGALYRLGDTSGAPVLLELAASEHASMRLTAATFLASQPDENWKSLVRALASDPDPSIRLDAARLIAPHDPDLARSVLDNLSRDANAAIREEAALGLVETSRSDFGVLRRTLRTGNSIARVRAADRVLALTR